MKLYLVQHAKAASKDVDPERPLTEEARRDIQEIAAFIRPLPLSADSLWHSGKRRAAQTADVLPDAIETKRGTIARDGLGPSDNGTALRSKFASTLYYGATLSALAICHSFLGPPL